MMNKRPRTPAAIAFEVLRWVIFPARRPGTLYVVIAIEGEQLDGSLAKLTRVSGGWAFEGEREPRRVYLEEHLLPMMANEFNAKRLHFRPQFAREFFGAAIRHVDDAAGHVLKADQHATELSNEPEDSGRAFAFILWHGEVDRAATESASAIVLGMAAAEAQANDWADRYGLQRTDARRRKNEPALVDVLSDLVKTAGEDLDLGKKPFQSLRWAIDYRNQLMHARPPPPLELGSRPYVAGRALVVDARRVLLIIRECFVSVAHTLQLDLEEVSYLASCPMANPQDDAGWRSANLLTGIRPDPDFSRVVRPTEPC